MKVVTVLGTRPEIIRLSRVIPKLDTHCEHVLVHTGQNFDRRLSDVFFDEMEVRRPDAHLEVRGSSPADQIAQILAGCEKVFTEQRPDRLLLLGDTNSALCALVAKRMGIPVFHMEAGNRCYDDRVPEEVNRRVIDHCSDVLMPYTERSRANLLREGIRGENVYVTGNPIREVIEHYRPAVDASQVLGQLGLERQSYFLVTLHRAENVDVRARVTAMVDALAQLSVRHACPVIVSTHPRMAARVAEFGLDAGGADVRFPEPFGLFDFVALESSARCVLTDSGTVQEECAIFGIPNVTLRDVTERPETLECGSNVVSGADVGSILRCVDLALSAPAGWTPPAEYMATSVSDTVVRLTLGYHLHLDRAQAGRDG